MYVQPDQLLVGRRVIPAVVPMNGQKWRTTSRIKCGNSSTRSCIWAYPNTSASFQGCANKTTAEKLDVFCWYYTLVRHPNIPKA